MKMVRHQAVGISFCNFRNILAIFLQKEIVICIFPKDKIFGISMIVNVVYVIWFKRLSVISHKYILDENFYQSTELIIP